MYALCMNRFKKAPVWNHFQSNNYFELCKTYCMEQILPLIVVHFNIIQIKLKCHTDLHGILNHR